jgi:hypothetical protein
VTKKAGEKMEKAGDAKAAKGVALQTKATKQMKKDSTAAAKKP